MAKVLGLNIIFGSVLFGTKNRQNKMKKIFITGILGFIVFTSQTLGAETNGANTLYIRSEIQTVLSGLSDNSNRFEYLQEKLEGSGKNNKSYDEHKNIWLSTILAIQAITSICEYENDLLTLLMDLKEERRLHYIDLRIKSLETSIQQITIMSEQILINHRLMPPDLAEIHLFDKLKKNVDSSVDFLKSAKGLILQLRKK